MKHLLINLSIAVSLAPGMSPVFSYQVSPIPNLSTPQNIIAQTNTITYDDPVMAIATKYPKNMTLNATCSGEGCGYFFNFKPKGNALDEAQLHIFLSAGARNAAQVERGTTDLIKGNGWTVDKKAKPPQHLMYPWVKKIITFSAEKNMMGYILIGETNRQGVRVTLLYPKQMSNDFLPAAKTILDNLRFKADKLPITTKG
jgi:hypothetical protein